MQRAENDGKKTVMQRTYISTASTDKLCDECAVEHVCFTLCSPCYATVSWHCSLIKLMYEQKIPRACMRLVSQLKLNTCPARQSAVPGRCASTASTGALCAGWTIQCDLQRLVLIHSLVTSSSLQRLIHPRPLACSEVLPRSMWYIRCHLSICRGITYSATHCGHLTCSS